MIEDAHSVPSRSELRCDICIIGGGAAGITMLRELAGKGRDVILLPGGGRRERKADRDLYHGSIAAGTTHEPLEMNRRRGWGGSTSIWGGRCVPLDAVDFSDRSYVPHSGWPLTYDDLYPYLVRANAVCEAGTYAYSVPEAFPDAPTEMIVGFDSSDLLTTQLERWSPPTKFGRRYLREVRSAPTARVFMGAHAVHIQLAQDGSRRVAHVRAASAPNHSFDVVASTYVLACGGLENPRLLLASNDVDRGGIGNRYDHLGRYYMSHIMGVLGETVLNVPGSDLIYGFERDDQGVYCRRRFWITPEAQARLRIGNGIGYLFRPDISDIDQKNPVFSATYLARSYAGALRSRQWRTAVKELKTKSQKDTRREHWRIVTRGAPRAVPQLARTGYHRWFAKRRLPMILGAALDRPVSLWFQTEHTPNRGSRVTLTSGRDAYGMPRLQMHAAFSEMDIETAIVFHALLAERLEKTGIGELRWGPETARDRLRDHLKSFNSNAHHLGTTRMSTRPEDGVVDVDGRVHDVTNLYVAGGSTFPTSGHANPTLSLVALSIRLADHLARV